MNKKKDNEISLFKGAVVVMLFALVGVLIIQNYWMNAIINLRKSIVTENIFMAFNESANEILLSRYEENKEGPMPELLDVPVEEMLQYKDLVENTLNYYLTLAEIDVPYYWAVAKRGNTEIIMGNYDQYEGADLKALQAFRASPIYHQMPYELIVRFANSSWQTPSVIFYTMGVSLSCMIILIAGTILNLRLHLKRQRELDFWMDFIGNMVHEFKTPMSSISLASELIMKTNVIHDPERIIQYSSLIYRENSHLKQMIDKLLRAISLDMGVLTLKLSEVDVHQEITYLFEPFSLKAEERGGTLALYLNATNYILNADRMHVINVITNLLDNAIKYTDEKPDIVVETRSTQEGLYIKVTDNGIGIPQDSLNKLFDKFYRVRSARSYSDSGYGLGLFYVSYIMHAHKGHVHVTSKIDKGSSFELFFPLPL